MPEGPRRDVPRRTGRSPLLRGLGLRRSALWKLAPRLRGSSLAGSSEPPASGHGGLQVGLIPPELTGGSHCHWARAPSCLGSAVRPQSAGLWTRVTQRKSVQECLFLAE